MSDSAALRLTGNLKNEYAVNLLKRGLSALGVGAIGDSGIPLNLSVDNTTRVAAGGFHLSWAPKIDPLELFDADFTWHGNHDPDKDVAAIVDPPSGRGQISAPDQTGILYGAMEFLERCEVRRSLPVRPLDVRRSPHLPLRMACLQLMKRGNYILPICPEQFPWFYDQAWWRRYLDFMVAQRFNAVALWNFHPFPYFCAIEGHPEVRELSDDIRDANAAHLRWLIAEAKQRGVQLLWHFYNIYVCPSYAKSHGLNSLYNQFTPAEEEKVYRYIRSSVRSFANAFPEVGFIACAGEGVQAGKAESFVADVLVAALNETSHHPRLVVRQWSTLSAGRFERDVVGKYDSLWAMIKHNAEHIAGTVPDARVSDWVATGIPMIVNMHMLSEIGPFRWSPPGYIRELCLHYKALGVKGIHIYPHWPWRTPDVGDRNFEGDELDRDWLYHAAWGRYSFDPVRDRDEEKRHWVRQASLRGIPIDAAEAMLDAYERSGPAMPRLQQHLWAHYDNHSVLPAGLTLGQFRFARSMHGRKIIRTDRLEDLSPLRATLQNWATQQVGYSFNEAAERSLQDLTCAIAEVESFAAGNVSEPARLHADLISMRWAAEYLQHKSQIALRLMEYHRHGDIAVLQQALSDLQQSLVTYRAYRAHAEQWYHGITDVPPYLPFHNYTTIKLPYTWTDCLEVFEREAANLQTFLSATQRDEPWSLVHHFGFDPTDDRRELQDAIVSDGGNWLTGDPDFLPWQKHISRMRTLVLLPCAVYPCAEISMLSDASMIRSWIHQGGRLIAVTLPERPWTEAKFLAEVLETDVDSMKTETIEHQDGCFRTIHADERWKWSRVHRDRGMVGHVCLGAGRIDFAALNSAPQWNKFGLGE
jgi:hypothetical protein